MNVEQIRVFWNFFLFQFQSLEVHHDIYIVHPKGTQILFEQKQVLSRILKFKTVFINGKTLFLQYDIETVFEYHTIKKCQEDSFSQRQLEMLWALISNLTTCDNQVIFAQGIFTYKTMIQTILLHNLAFDIQFLRFKIFKNLLFDFESPLCDFLLNFFPGFCLLCICNICVNVSRLALMFISFGNSSFLNKNFS